MRSAGANDVQTESTNLQIVNSDQVEMGSTNLQIMNSDQVEMESTDLKIVNFDQVEMESTDLQILKSDKIEVDLNVIAITENRNGYESGDDDIELQQILFYSAQFHSGKKINKDIHEMIAMKCPASDCKGILDLDSIMSVDFLMRVRDAIRLTEVLVSSIFIDCLFMDCMGTLVDDLREYPIRSCPECWRIFCVNCKSLYLGMTYENYQFSRQLNLLYWQQQYGGYHDELEEDEKEEEKENEDDDEGEEEER
uniref:Uncharacterized protein n=1 Tax=Solanum tuberosum TaxID=4113 RepID=M1CU40_SOLTU